MEDKYPITKETKEELEKELAYLRDEKQGEIRDKIKYLRGFCDFSDNISFDESLEEQGQIRERIMEIQDILDRAEIIQPREEENKEVVIGSLVSFMEVPDGERESYRLVGKLDANPLKHNISIDSPIGRALLGKGLGDKVSIETPDGNMEIEILDIL